jgi:pyruvate dehydrogenase E2 component (dihydrolipoamide acetyltransferase)
MDVLMPQLGETVTEGKITKWFKSAGDAVKPGDNLFEIETDKVSMEVPSIAAGTLAEIRVPAGAVAPVGFVVAVIAGAMAAAGPAPAAPSPQRGEGRGEGGRNYRESVTPHPSPLPMGEGVPPASAAAQRVPRQRSVPLDPFFEVRTPSRNFGPAKLPGGTSVTPLARRLAGENGIDLARLSGSGPHGRIVAADVETAIAKSAGMAAAGRGAPPALATGASAAQVMALYRGVAYEEIPLDGMRSTIARRLVEAKQTVPHFYLTADVTMDALNKLREEANAGATKNRQGEGGEPAYKLSVNDFVIKALALALQRVPLANAVWAGDRILRFTHSDVGVAVAIDGGLLTPVIRNAEGKSLSAISNEMRELAARAREKKLKPAEYQGGASAISNLGMYGVREFAAIINPPHSTILAVGAAQRRPVEAEDGAVKFVSQMAVTLSCDHRVVDGALGAELLAAFRALIESPVRMLV